MNQKSDKRGKHEAEFCHLTDSDGENSETDSSLDFARDCGYLTTEKHEDLSSRSSEIGKMLGSMINNPKSFLIHD